MPNIGTLPAHYRPNIAHLVTIFVSLSDRSETYLSTGRVRQTFASNGKRRAGRDGLGEVKGPRDTVSTTPRPRQLPLKWAERTVPLVPSRGVRHVAHRGSQLGWPGNTALDGALYVRRDRPLAACHVSTGLSGSRDLIMMIGCRPPIPNPRSLEMMT